MKTALGALALLLLLPPLHSADVIELKGRAMGTTWSVKWVKTESAIEERAVEKEIAARLEELEDQFSTYRAGSELARFNATRGTEWFPVSTAVAQLAIEAHAISELTAGAFDVTVDPLVRLWGFGPGRRGPSIPMAPAIAEARARVGWRHLEARGDSPALRRSRPGVTVDFSSIAKGFAVDALSELLRSAGATHHFVQIGGDVKTSGHTAGGASWATGIESPVDGARTIAQVVPLSGEALSTAGDYRNHFWHEGRRYGHIIDPRTGVPVVGGLASVAVIHPQSCARSSALATALFVLGADEGYQLAVRLKLSGIFFVRAEKGFERRVTPELVARLR